ncbi:hypothetical protein [Bacillus manliponensis]|uniref:hypothetical protein n=1 Tax=Bacillus manliponensis TaxID=574376 RepID=UPI000B1F03BA|nr:hypothetical protein [Bacillus manliponensis]
MKKFLEVVGAVFLAFVDGKRVAAELNAAEEQTNTPQKETDILLPLLQPSHT